MDKAKFCNGMVVFWQDPEGLVNPENNASRYDIICDIDYENGTAWLGRDTEVFLSECRLPTSEELWHLSVV